MTSIKTPPVSMPDQVLCKRATVERMKAQHLRWMAQREAALSKPKPLTEQSREESLTRQHGHAANTLCRATNPPMARSSYTAKAEQHVAQSARRGAAQWHARRLTRVVGQQPQRVLDAVDPDLPRPATPRGADGDGRVARGALTRHASSQRDRASGAPRGSSQPASHVAWRVVTAQRLWA